MANGIYLINGKVILVVDGIKKELEIVKGLNK